MVDSMNRQMNCAAALGLSVILMSPTCTLAAGVQARFDFENPEATLFPSNLFTLPDKKQNTGLRVALPSPDCVKQASNCELIKIINTLDGFNLQPRISIPFTGPIDVETVSSETVFLINLGSTLDYWSEKTGEIVGINQVVWDPETSTLHVESDELLEQHTRYALVVTNGVRDLAGDPIESRAFRQFRRELVRKRKFRPYRKALGSALRAARRAGVGRREVVAAGVFTTQSITAILEKIRDQIKTATPAPPDFQLGFDGSLTVFPVEEVKDIVASVQLKVRPNETKDYLVVGGLEGWGSIAFGKYRSPDYRSEDGLIPRIATRAGIPAVFGTNEVVFNLFLPPGPKPQDGWPVVIYGHGSGIGKDQLLGSFVSLDEISNATPTGLGEVGIAMIVINAVGHGGGPESALLVERVAGDTVAFLSGGRGVDLNQDGLIGKGMLGNDEGFNFNGFSFDAVSLYDNDGQRQTTVDLMQLVRLIEEGLMDVDGDGVSDLNGSRIFYQGVSLGGSYGALFLAAEPRVSAGVLNVVGASTAHFRLALNNRPALEVTLATVQPPLTNRSDPSTCLVDYEPFDCAFDENLPLRNQPSIVNDVPGAIAIQVFIDKVEWLGQSGSALAYAAHLRKNPLASMPPKSVLIQFARGDLNVPNPGTTALLRAGDLADRATFYRHDLAFNDPDRTQVPLNPHDLLEFIISPPVEDIGFHALRQIVEFLASDGTVVIDPDGAEPLFETPIKQPLPEDCGYVVEIPSFTVCE